jgi:cytochrome c553
MKWLFERLLVLIFMLVAGIRMLFAPGSNMSSMHDATSYDEQQAGFKWNIKQRLATIAGLLIFLAIVGLLVSASGIVPIKASSGHWAITRWFLSFSMSRSVATHSMGIVVPPLDDQRLRVMGAGHFHVGCAPCHGSPEKPRSPVVLEMTPVPPDLAMTVPNWEPDELYYITKHGIKMTGMPAWPDRQRNDEIWAVTSFLLELPDMDVRGYQQLVYANGAAPRSPPDVDLTQLSPASLEALQECSRCHGVDGHGRGDGAFPALAGQQYEYLDTSLRAYAEQTRHSGIMEVHAAALDVGTRQEISQHYASLAPRVASDRDGETAIDRGKAIVFNGVAKKGIPACIGCHGPSQSSKNPHYPRLSGQHFAYLATQLALFHDQKRGGSQYAHLMRQVATKLSEEQMRDVATYYASLNHNDAAPTSANNGE